MGGASLLLMGLSLVASVLIYSFVINLLVKRPDGSAFGFGRALLNSVVYMIVMVILGIIAGVIIGVLFGAAMMGAAGMG
jgi:ABC-type phosphate transport system permease subunit